MQEIIYDTDLYLRLSKEDGDKEESDSIANQRDLLLDWINKQPNMRLHKIRIDDGYSGVDFRRPAFSEMIQDISGGLVNCVVVKDFSRFGRNYIESGKYIQQLFPRTGIRFVAVNDGYDSSKVQGYTDNIIVPFKNMMNEMYARDIFRHASRRYNILPFSLTSVNPFNLQNTAYCCTISPLRNMYPSMC